MTDHRKLFFRLRPLGLTVLEMLIGLSAISVIALLVVPSAHTAYHEFQVKKVARNMVETLNIARTEAANRGGISRLCPSSNYQTCRSNKDWRTGWVVFLDGNADGQVQEFERVDAYELTDPNITVTAHGAVESAASFTITGLATPGMDGKPSEDIGEFRICYEGSTGQGRRVIVEPDGWVIAEPLSEKTCNPNTESQG